MREDGKPDCGCKYCRRDGKSQREVTRMFFPERERERDEGGLCVLGKRKRGSQRARGRGRREKGVIDLDKAKDYRLGMPAESKE